MCVWCKVQNLAPAVEISTCAEPHIWYRDVKVPSVKVQRCKVQVQRCSCEMQVSMCRGAGVEVQMCRCRFPGAEGLVEVHQCRCRGAQVQVSRCSGAGVEVQKIRC